MLQLQSSFVFFNVLVIVINALLYLAILLFVLRHLRSSSAVMAYGIFWGGMAILWILVSVRLVAAVFGHPDLDRLFYVFGQSLLLVVLPAVGYWGAMNASAGNKKFTRLFTGGIVFLSLAFFLFLVIGLDEIEKLPETLWGTKYHLPKIASILFIITEALIFSTVLFAVVRQTFFRQGHPIFFAHLGANGAILLFSVAGFIDELSLTASGQLILVRILFLLSAVIAYIALSAERMREEIPLLYGHTDSK